MNTTSTAAIILRRVNYGEADRIITFLTPEGKVSGLAKGVRRAKSKLAGGLELFSVSDIVYVSGKGSLKTVTSARLKHHYGDIAADYNATQLAYETLRLVGELTSEESDEEYELFAATETAMQLYADTDFCSEAAFVWFVMQLSRMHGSAMNLEHAVGGKKFVENARYAFSPDDMAFAESPNGQYGPRHIKLLRLCANTKQPSRLVTIEGVDELASELLPIAKQAAHYIQQG